MRGSPKTKGLPVYYHGTPYPVSRILRTRSLHQSPCHSPRRGALQHGGMQLLRVLVMLGLALLGASLLYVQVVAAGRATRAASTTYTAEGVPPAAAAADANASSRTASEAATAAAKQPPDAAAAPPVQPSSSFPAPDLTHLVLVAGHAVYTGLDYAVANQESSWFLEPYQQVDGEAQSFLDHIRLGIEAAASDPRALLLFSGGQTRKAAGPRSEGLSYWMVAEAAEWFTHQDVRNRAYTEEHARDSFENVLFSLCRFYEITGHYPAKITAVSYTLKQKRFEQVHRAALRFPADAFNFIGTPVPPAAKGAVAGEAATVAGFLRDPYGCSGALLAKKARRDPFAVGAPHPSRCPAMAGLLQYCGAKVYSGSVPWDNTKGGGGSATAAGAGAASQGQQPGGLSIKGRKSSRSGIYT